MSTVTVQSAPGDGDDFVGLPPENNGLEKASQAARALIDVAESVCKILKASNGNGKARQCSQRYPNGGSADNALLSEPQEFWETNDGLSSEHRFHSRLYFMIKLFGNAYKRDDMKTMCRAALHLHWLIDRLSTEPWLSKYITALVLCHAKLGLACADRFRLDEAYAIAEKSAALLEAKADHRARLGLKPQPDSECWYRLFDLTAQLKWKGTVEERNKLWTPEEIIERFSAVELRVLTYIERVPSADNSRNERVVRALAWCRLHIIKMAYRWCESYKEALINRFNEIHGNILTTDNDSFLAQSQPGTAKAWYWDLELFKWCTRGRAKPEEALYCHQWRLDTLRGKQYNDEDLTAYTKATSLELDFLLSLGSQRTG